MALAEGAVKKNTTEEKNNDNTEKETTKDINLNTTGNTLGSQRDLTQQEMKNRTNPTCGISLFGVGGIKRKKKDKTNTIITVSTAELKTEEEQEHDGGDIAMTSGV